MNFQRLLEANNRHLKIKSLKTIQQRGEDKGASAFYMAGMLGSLGMLDISGIFGIFSFVNCLAISCSSSLQRTFFAFLKSSPSSLGEVLVDGFA
jgi:hypothetical protein